MKSLNEAHYDKEKYKTEWWYDEPISKTGKSYWLLKVDDESTEAEIEAEIEYWMLQYSLGGTPQGDKAIMAAVHWMMQLMEHIQ